MIITLGTTPAVQKTLAFERLVIDDVNRTGDTSMYASGKSINAARVLHTLGKPVLTLGFAGGDSGAFLRRDLDATGIKHALETTAAATRTCTTVLDRAAGTATELIEEPLAATAGDYDRLLLTLQTHLRTAKLLLLSGSLPPGAPMDFYARCISACQAANVPVILDATGEPLRQALAQKPTIVKPNRRELGETVDMPVESEPQLRRAIGEVISAGAKWAVVTAGKEPTIVSDGRSFWTVSTPTVEVVSAIGSGDSFAAGLAAAVAEGQSVPQATRLAAACGAANAMTARAGHVERSAVDTLLMSIGVRTLKA